MGKAKEYSDYLQTCYFSEREKDLLALKTTTMNHKTLEDVEKLINKYQQHLFHGDITFDWLKDELEKLKL